MKVQACSSIGLLIAALMAASCGEGGRGRVEPIEADPLPVTVVSASAFVWPGGVEETATLLPLRRATPGTTLMGRVEQILKREGDRVRAGEPLARIESREVEARLAQAESAVTAARAMSVNARLMKDRMDRLESKQAASRKNVEDASAAWEAANAQVHAAEEGVKVARVSAGYATIRAPFAGIIVARHIEAGDLASPGMPLFTIEDDSMMKVESAIPESLAAQLRAGAPAVVTIPAASPPERTGELDAILPNADPRTRTFTARVILENGDGSLRPGMYARVRIGKTTPSPADAPTLSVPVAALIRQGPLSGLFVVDESGAPAARLRWVTTGREKDGQVEILTGLREGERVIVGGGAEGDSRHAGPPVELEDGRRIEVR